MKGDTIKCWTCGKTFKDTTKQTDKLTEAGNTYQWKGQDSRNRVFKNMCPFCYGTRTRNVSKMTEEELEKLTARHKLIYHAKQCISRSNKRMKCWYCGFEGVSILDKYGCCLRCKTNLKKYSTPSSHPTPRMSSEAISTEVLGLRTKMEEEKTKSRAELTHPTTETAIKERQENSRDFVMKSVGVFDSRSSLSFIELADMVYRKMLQSHKQRLLPFNNEYTYRHWRRRYANTRNR